MRLCTPGFELSADHRRLEFNWHGGAVFEAYARRLTAIHVKRREEPGALQLIFHFQPGPAQTPGLVVMRADITPDFEAVAQRFIAKLRRMYNIQEVTDPEDDSGVLSRVPQSSPEWLVTPTRGLTEALYELVGERLAKGRSDG